jgi:hypothetical protein
MGMVLMTVAVVMIVVCGLLPLAGGGLYGGRRGSAADADHADGDDAGEGRANDKGRAKHAIVSGR